MESLWQDCRYAVRMLLKDPGFAAVAVLVLALGIGANTAIFTLTNSLLLRPIQAEAPEDLVALYSKHTTRPDSYRAFSYPNYLDIRDLNTTFTSLLAHDLTMVGLSEGEVTQRVFAEFASHNYLDTYGVTPFRGRFFNAAEEVPGSAVPVAVATYEYWRSHGQDPDLVGETLEVNGHDLTIVGIAPRGFTGRTALLSPGLYLPFGMHHLLMSDTFTDADAALAERDNHRVFLVGRLRPGIGMEEADAQLASLASRMEEEYPSINEDQTIIVGPLSRMGISTDPDSGDAQVSLVAVLMLAMTGIILLIACINLANMMLARGAARRREFAIRAAIGGGRGRILRQLLTEGLLMSVLGGVVGLGIAYVVNRLLAVSVRELMAANGLSMDLLLHSAPDVRVLVATGAFCMVGTLLFGFGPAWRQSRPDVMADLKEQAGDGASRSGRRGMLRRGNLLIVSQVALSLVLLTSAGLFIRGALEAADVDPGLALDRGLLVEVDPSLVGYEEARGRDLYQRLRDRLVSIPGVDSVSIAATVPFGTVSSGQRVRRAEELPSVSANGGEEIETVAATSNIVGADYFETVGLALLRGREFNLAEADSDGGPRVAIIDQRLADWLWPDQDPIGRQIGFGRTRTDDGAGDMEVVGVVATVRDDLFQSTPRPHVYVPFGQNYQDAMYLHLSTATTGADAQAAMLPAIRSEIRAVDEQLPIMSLKTLRSHIMESASLWMVRVGATIFTSFGALALILAVVGVYGVKAYTVAQRTREIGVRKALGATTGETLSLLLRESVLLTAVGLGLGLVLAALVARALASLLYEVSALDPFAFVVAPLILAAASLIATYLPARRAASISPITALRQD